MTYRFQHFLIKVILLISFLMGLLSIMGFAISLTRLFIYSLVLILLIVTLINKSDDIKLPQIRTILFLTGAVIIGNVINQGSWISFFRLYLDIIIGFVFMYSVLNLNTINLLIKKLKPLIIVIISIQICAAIYKFIFIGIQESDLIGTMSNSAGSLSVIFPLFITSLIIPFLIKKFKVKYLIFLALLVFFSIVGDKRAMIFFFPLVFLFGYFVCNKLVFKKLISFKKIFIFSLLGFSVFYIGSRTLPTLNPQKEIWGEFDFVYVKNYISDYNAYGENQIIGREYSRVNAPVYFIDALVNLGTSQILFGLGPVFVTSQFVNSSAAEKLPIDYGYQGRASFNYLLIQIGLLALILIIFSYYNLLKKIIKRIKTVKNQKGKLFISSVVIMFFIWILDFMFYSSTMYLITPMVLIFHLAIGITLNQHLDLENI